jgi:hypothetical protein
MQEALRAGKDNVWEKRLHVSDKVVMQHVLSAAHHTGG